MNEERCQICGWVLTPGAEHLWKDCQAREAAIFVLALPDHLLQPVADAVALRLKKVTP